MKQISLLMFEGIIVGISLVFLALVIEKFPALPVLTGNPMIDGTFYTGMLGHLLFEITGLNIWYSKNYCSLLNKSA